jgi:anti-anti-sigma factor
VAEAFVSKALMFSITESSGVEGPTLVVHGAIDLANAPALLNRGRRAIAGGGVLTLDLSDVDMVDSVGIGVLLGLRKAARDSGDTILLTAISPQVSASLESHGVSHLFLP